MPRFGSRLLPHNFLASVRATPLDAIGIGEPEHLALQVRIAHDYSGIVGTVICHGMAIRVAETVVLRSEIRIRTGTASACECEQSRQRHFRETVHFEICKHRTL